MALSEEGAQRLAEAALWTNGGSNVMLRLPGLAVSGSEAEQLGLATPQFQDVTVGPAAWRETGGNASVLLVASEISKLVGSQGLLSAESLFEVAVGFVVEDVLYTITRCEPLIVSGSACAYRVGLKAPARV